MTDAKTKRVITSEGDGNAVHRLAFKFDAKTAIRWTHYDDAPLLELVVSPHGVAELTARRYGRRDAVTLWRGRIGDDGVTTETEEA